MVGGLVWWSGWWFCLTVFCTVAICGLHALRRTTDALLVLLQVWCRVQTSNKREPVTSAAERYSVCWVDDVMFVFLCCTLAAPHDLAHVCSPLHPAYLFPAQEEEGLRKKKGEEGQGQ